MTVFRVVLDAKGFDLDLRVHRRGEEVLVQAFVAQSTVEAVDECVEVGLGGPTAVKSLCKST